ncbi:lipid IV(A) 3-deoxy-D-manno-octulosonic acid transferase [Paraburkholderia sp. 22099]|jgi:3-deoxy-D-manno-octulosonic-acid transferase|uniref:3-deoxy-D-manno-octulosonic acid transferase n=1 Tax=Paraburkholderia terricola TaxID=169427 RepID=A0A1M6VT63_9BURK|nr:MULTISPECIES: lipid IV(A) 3-deoxy-D-manno-octulosonic acid transferase [Paraburkholderia]ORC46753.1 3-deoxy-D-manno-octulosonic acid transferase [Burkholderia sp. A27]MDR6407543.1 3-deoxy-D-manno-octulosonic-acid transferase [Paraburkholderia terricola]MDR6480242.1 3-deoxy-D-manno-octulosonic-acid transferase [Paraburkholderia terricola]MDR6492206.1 3-deoxy-D-manno-octulosonic-acid transferase [Paraburkholderia terricola]SDP09571.1 3-deoxy-D-manno-octulosonic-acid transferase [Paraburkholde
MLRAVYNALWWIVAPLAVLRLLIRSRKERGYREHIGERFGYARGRLPEDSAPLIWVHAVSVGETRAAQPLIDALIKARPDARILLTHMTPSGRATGEQIFGDRVLRSYLPYDMPHAVRRFLRTWRPSLGLVMETEVWPTLIDECRRADVPLVLTNARMSARSFGRAAKFGQAAKGVFGGFARVLAQSPSDAERLTALGARNVAVLGNLKFDMSTPPELAARGHAWRAAIGARPVWVAASTREGEEQLVLQAFAALGVDDALLILVPRHPQRFNEVAALVEKAGLRLERRSGWAPAAQVASGAGVLGDVPALPAEVNVLLGDSMGELGAYYAAADLAFIGGSLLPLGGQNLIEACAVGVPVLIGPHVFNFTQATADAVAAGAAVQVQDPADLARALRELFNDRARRLAMGGAASAFAARHRGATARTVDVLMAVLPE